MQKSVILASFCWNDFMARAGSFSCLNKKELQTGIIEEENTWYGLFFSTAGHIKSEPADYVSGDLMEKDGTVWRWPIWRFFTISLVRS